MNTNLLNIINSIIEKKQISWKFGIYNARLVMQYAVGCNSISEMLFSQDSKFTGVLVPNFELSETIFLEKLKIKHWSYSDFIISAMLFCIQYEIIYGASNLIVLFKNLVFLLFDETILGEEIFNVLKDTNIFNLYRQNALSGINLFFYGMNNTVDSPQRYFWNKLGIARILSLFSFNSVIIQKCIADCKDQNTLGPFILASYALEINLSFSSLNDQEKWPIIANFKQFKAFLKEKKYLNNSFFLKLYLEPKNIKNFYGSNIKIELNQSASLAGIAVLATGSAWVFAVPKIVSVFPNVFRGSSQNQPEKLNLQQVKKPSTLSLLPESTKIYNRPRLTVYAKDFSTDPANQSSSLPMGSVLGASKNNWRNDNVKIITRSVYVPKRNFTYEYYILYVNGVYSFCPYGIYGQYNNLKYDMKHHIVPHAESFFKELGIPFIYSGNYAEYQLDHVSKQCFRDAFHISEDKAYVVVVPPPLNGPRTNIAPKYEFSQFDYRFSGSWDAKEMPQLFELLKVRLWESLLWTREMVLYKLNDPLLKLVIVKLEKGYNYAATREMFFIQDNFIDKFKNRDISIMNRDSYFGFLNELLLQARVEDFDAMKKYKLEYIQSANNLVSKNFFIRQVVLAADMQIRTAQALSELITKASAKHSYMKRHDQLTQDLQYELQTFINSNATVSSFNLPEAETFLTDLSNSKTKNFLVKKLLTLKNNKYVYLKEMCNEILQLGNSYTDNGKILDLTLNAAKDFAKQVGQPKGRYLEQPKQELVEQLLFPDLSTLSSSEYSEIIKKEPSQYAKMALKKTAPWAVSPQQYEDELLFSNSFSMQKMQEEMQSGITQEEPVSDSSDLPSVPRRQTSDQERLERLKANDLPSVPARKTSDQERAERLKK